MEYLLHKSLFKIFFFIFFIPTSLSSQNVYKEIDSLLIIENESLRNKITSEKLIDWNKRIAKKCINDNYKRGEALAYANIANSLWVNQKYKESLFYLQKAEKVSENINDVYVKGKTYIEFAQTYHYMGLSDMAHKYCNMSLSYFLKMPDNIMKNRALTYAYGCNAIYLYALKKNDDALKSLKNATKIIPNPLDVSNIGYHYTNIEYNKDSASFYFNKAFKLLDQPNYRKNYYLNSAVFLEFVNLKLIEKNPKEALKILNKTEKIIYKTNNKTLLLNYYISKFNVYKSLGDTKNEQKYLNEYYVLKDSIDIKNRNGVNTTVNQLYNKDKKGKEIIDKKNNYLKILILCSSIVLIGLIILLFFYQKRKKELYITTSAIKKYKEKTNNLEKKVNESFIEIINLAKENHPNFYTRFQEVYPDLQKKVLAINPNLQNSELVLLAYIYLNFETKEIADYLFKSPKTIQNRKHSLRKKLQIPSSEDIYVWLKTL